MQRDGFARFDVARFAAHRIVRIVPPYYLAIAFFVAFALALNASRFPRRCPTERSRRPTLRCRHSF
jgi:peptidoglycan/LPS O-acetylase OafA/YrhL